MRRAALLVFALGALLASDLVAAASQASILEAFTRAQLTLENQLMTQTLDAYRSARSRQEQAERRAAQLAQRLDREIDSDGSSVEELESLHESVGVAQQNAEAAASESAALRRLLLEHRRRARLLAELLRDYAVVETVADPLSGRWQVLVLPFDQRGTFELELDGTLVSGSYSLDGDYAGSLRGTFVGGVVRLERIDAEHGFDVVYEGRLDAAEGRLDGAWTSTLLNAPGPTGGTWVAFRPTDEDAGGAP